MNLDSLQTILKGQPAYRIKQIHTAIFRDGIDDWTNITTLPLPLRETLQKGCSLTITATDFQATSSESQKALITLSDGLKIEAVLMHHIDGRNTICVSSQVGCPIGCMFCLTGTMGFKRNLLWYEILEQVIYFARYLRTKNERVTNVVFMGMGEPFLNYDNVIAAIKIFNDPHAFNIGARHLSVSTAGVIPGIEHFTEEDIEVNLALSLHGSNDTIRSKIMPINKKYPLKELFQAISHYIEKTNRRVMFEYILIKDVNDSPDNAEELSILLKPILGFVNLIPYNDTGVFKATSQPQIQSFKAILEKNGIIVTQRHRFGEDIQGACGQLAYKD